MTGAEKGKIGIKTRGRKAGQKLKVIGKEKGFLIVEDSKGKKKKCNPRHLLMVGGK